MYRFVVRRVLLALLTLFVVSVATFFMLRLIPGDIVDLMISDFGYAADRATILAQLGLDEPIHRQFADWFGGLFVGDLGYSLWAERPVTHELARRYPVTLELSAIALIVSTAVAIPVGIVTAVRQDTWADYLLRSVSIGLVAVPILWIGTIIITLPALFFGWAPPLTYVPFAEDPIGNLSVMVLPGVIIGIPLLGGTIRMTRAMMLEVVRQDYVRTAWAKGLRPRTIWYRHAVRNALIPVLSLIGLQIPFLLGGTVIIEQIFNLPGMGVYLLQSLQLRDYVPAQTIVLLFAGRDRAHQPRGRSALQRARPPDPVRLAVAVDAARARDVPPQPTSRLGARGGIVGLVVRLFTEKPLGAVGAVIVLIMLVMALFADWIAPYPFDEPHFSDALQGSSLTYLLGTDFIGRDLFSRLVHGARVSIIVALGSVALGSVLAALIGITSGYFGGRYDTIVQRLVDAWMSVPPLLLLLFVMSILGPSPLNVTLVLGLVAIRESRVLRGSVLALKEQPFVEAARGQRGGDAAHPDAPRPPERDGAHHHPGQPPVGPGDPDRGVAELPRLRRAQAVPLLGSHAQFRVAHLHGDRAVAGHLARRVPEPDRLRLERARRRAAGSARPAPARHRRRLPVRLLAGEPGPVGGMPDVAVIGLGPMGAAVGRTVRAALPTIRIAGFDPDRAASRRAAEAGAIDEACASVARAVAGARLVVLATPLAAARDVLGILGRFVPAGAVVTDTCALKVPVLRWAQEHLPAGVPFVGGHPLAGRTGTGGLALEGADYCIVPGAAAPPEAVDAVVGLANAAGARPFFVDAAEHDSFVIATEYLPRIAAGAAVDAVSSAPGWRDAQRFRGAGFGEAVDAAEFDPGDLAVAMEHAAGALASWTERLVDAMGRLRALTGDPMDAAATEELLAGLVRERRERLRPPSDGGPHLERQPLSSLLLGEWFARRDRPGR